MAFEALFIGGISSGKSALAEQFTLGIASAAPIYLATTEFVDAEMKQKIHQHQKQREGAFVTLEEGVDIAPLICEQKDVVLVECISMWINNMLYHNKEADIFPQLQTMAQTANKIVCVINDVSHSPVAPDPLTRKFVNLNGRVSQFIAKEAKTVFSVQSGIGVQIK